MLKRFFVLTLVTLTLSFSAVANAQSESKSEATTKYERFLKRTDVVIVTQSHSLGSLPGGGWKILAKVAWALGESQKVYAAEVGDQIVDFDQLTTLEEGLNKMVGAVNGSFDSLNLSSMSYVSSGISANYYSYVTDESSQPKRNLYLKAGVFWHQSPKIDALAQLRDLIVKARERLVSLGAK
jgi:hypothetical protein